MTRGDSPGVKKSRQTGWREVAEIAIRGRTPYRFRRAGARGGVGSICAKAA